MESSAERILVIDVSSTSIKVALITKELTIDDAVNFKLKIYNENQEGFAKSIDMKDLWDKVKLGIKTVISKSKGKKIEIIGISSCAQRIATVFLDDKGNVIYGGPNADMRGIDSAYIIEDAFPDNSLFEITAHTPPILFCLARILWFREEKEELYNKISKVLMLDDWLTFKLTDVYVSDHTTAVGSQIYDVKRLNWSSEIIDTFDLDPYFFPDLVTSGTIIGDLKTELNKKLGISQKAIPVVKTGGDTQAMLLGMSVMNEGDIGISLGTTTPIHLVMNEPIIDKSCNFWTTVHCIKNKWLLEANVGVTGYVYDWFKNNFLKLISNNPDELMEEYLDETEPGSLSTFAYLGPEMMNINEQVSIKRGAFIFQPPLMINEEFPGIKHFSRSLMENIAFGIKENLNALEKYGNGLFRVYCAGGMSKSDKFCQLISNVINKKLMTPSIKDSSFIGVAINTLKGLGLIKNINSLMEKFLNLNTIKPEMDISRKYSEIFMNWKFYKNKVDDM